MKKYLVEYNDGRAEFFTNVPNPAARFLVLARTCFGVDIYWATVIDDLGVDRDRTYERIDFDNGDSYEWREDGARRMVRPEWLRRRNFDTFYCDICKYKGEE